MASGVRPPQTEIDALATLRPDLLRRIVETALEPYYDRTLAGRIQQAAADWRDQAQEVIDAHVDADELDGIRDNVETIQAEATERIEALKTEIEGGFAVENARLHELSSVSDSRERRQFPNPSLRRGRPIPF